jgi:hypothetical protein
MALFDAFISYSHAKDKPIASTLQSVIQTLGKPWYKRRALRIFRDDASLSATPHLWPKRFKQMAREVDADESADSFDGIVSGLARVKAPKRNRS